MAEKREPLEKLVNTRQGLISRHIFSDPDIYRQELEKLFTRSWLFLGHSSEIPKPGDFITNYMGKDPVVVINGKDGKIRAFLNSCQHRGMKICRLDAGNAHAFTCIYHGWTYSDNGDLVAVPYEKTAYPNGIDKQRWSLLKVPKLESYGGLLFGNWDEDAESLETYLGDLRFYFDVFLNRSLGDLTAVSGRQKYNCATNWKIPTDNFCGDDYHVPWTHGSYMKLGIMENYAEMPNYSFTFRNGHGIGDISLQEDAYSTDLSMAKELGKEAVEYVKECRERLLKLLKPKQARVYAFGHGNVFPNFSLNDFSALWPVGLYQWHPRGPEETEVWQTCLIDSGAPDSVRQAALGRFTHVQSAAGAFGQDDSENFEQVTEATRGVIAQRSQFNYQLGLDVEIEDEEILSLPGIAGPRFSEHGQRNYYSHWLECMRDGFPNSKASS